MIDYNKYCSRPDGCYSKKGKTLCCLGCDCDCHSAKAENIDKIKEAIEEIRDWRNMEEDYGEMIADKLLKDLGLNEVIQ